jgi:hypothetical protein
LGLIAREKEKQKEVFFSGKTVGPEIISDSLRLISHQIKKWKEQHTNRPLRPAQLTFFEARGRIIDVNTFERSSVPRLRTRRSRANNRFHDDFLCVSADTMIMKTFSSLNLVIVSFLRQATARRR